MKMTTYPNPFFELGIGWDREISATALSRNNVVKQDVIPTLGTDYELTYQYEYLPDAYPSKVTVH